MKFFSTPMQVCRGPSIPYFNIKTPFFCCLLFSKEYIIPQVKIDYQPSPSGLTTRINTLLFLQTHKVFVSFQNACQMFSQTCISQANLLSSDYWKMHLYFTNASACKIPHQNLIITFQAEDNYPNSQQAFFQKSLPQQ